MEYLELTKDIIIGLGIIIGAFLFNKTKPIHFRVILIGLIISYGLTFPTQFVLIYLSYWIFGISTFAFSIYNGLNKKWLNFVVGLFAFISIIWEIMNWSFYGELQLLMIIPIVCYLLMCKNWKVNVNQLSILSILGFYELTQFIELISGWLY